MVEDDTVVVIVDSEVDRFLFLALLFPIAFELGLYITIDVPFDLKMTSGPPPYTETNSFHIS